LAALLLIAFLGFISLASPAVASDVNTAKPSELKQVDFQEKLNAQIPLDLPFVNEAGQPVQLQQFFGSKPVILALVYYSCPMLCTQTLNGLVRTVRAMSFRAGTDYRIVTVSFDPREKAELAAAKKANYLRDDKKRIDPRGWAFLTGPANSIKGLTDAVGFRYTYNKISDQFAHPAGLIVLSPEGHVTRYFYGIDFRPRDLQLALQEASQGKVGRTLDRVLFYCYVYDPALGRYTMSIMRVMRVAALATAGLVACSILWMIRREKFA
jgi:protein SCO1/2